MTHTRRSRAAAAALVVSLALGACGAGDARSGATDPQPARCPMFQELTPNFTRLLQEDRFSGLRAVLEDELSAPLDPRSASGATLLSSLLGVLLDVVREVEVAGFKSVLVALLRSTTGGSLLPQLAGVLRYIDGRVACTAGTRCDRYDFLDKLRLVLTSTTCSELPGTRTGESRSFDAQTVLDLLVRLVRHPRLPELLDLLPRLLQNPTFRSVLDSFRFEQCGQSRCEQEDGFAALLQILLDNVLVPPIPWATIRDLLRQVGFNTPEITQLLVLAEDLLREDAPDERNVIKPLRTAIRCARLVDPAHVISRNLYRLLSVDEVSLDALLAGVDSLLDADPERKTIELAAQALTYFRERALASFRLVQRALDVLLVPANARRVLPALIALVDEGVVPELTNLLLALTDDCTMLTPAP